MDEWWTWALCSDDLIVCPHTSKILGTVSLVHKQQSKTPQDAQCIENAQCCHPMALKPTAKAPFGITNWNQRLSEKLRNWINTMKR